MGDGVLRDALNDLLRRSAEAGEMLSWGFVITGRPYETGEGYGLLEVVTPAEKVALTPSLVHRTTDRLLLWSGVARVEMYVPDCADGAGPDVALPAIDLRITLEQRGKRVTGIMQLPWDLACDYPVAVLTAGHLKGWPM